MTRISALFLLVVMTVSSFSVRNESSSRVKSSSVFFASPQSDFGSSKTPYDKKKIAVFGTGGYWSAILYGFLQRASSIYGTGISSVNSSPRAICATSVGSASLNKILSQNFKLAFCGENNIRLTNLQDVENIAVRVKGMEAVVMGTVYQLKQLPVTANSFEKSPNDKTLEFFMDDRYTIDWAIDEFNDIHLKIFQNTIDACVKTGTVQHVVVLETPSTPSPKPFAEILDRAGIPFTYISTGGSPWENTKLFTFESGVQSDISLKGFTFDEYYQSQNGYSAGDWSEFFQDEIKKNAKNKGHSIPREDLAAVAAQSLMSLDWTKSRCIHVSSNGAFVTEEDEKMNKTRRKVAIRSDKHWLLQSENLAQKVRAME